ncbi:hypothetical protein [Bradyrhizobium sp. ARR65]|uniref:hypothetical protein n=1 Tax=Bradyrhizobium sp. ARR65 TaxID=1040989 RepID=UPI000463B934|nr:hypothetical protein [Bradyrhizobium sp. ARR65]
MTPTAYIAHQVAGRIRLRVTEKRGDDSYFETVKQKLSANSAVERLKVTPETASILLHHAGSFAPIAAAAAEYELFRIADRTTAPTSQSSPLTTSGVGPASALDAVATGLSGLALFQLARGQAFGSAVENFWNAYGAKQLLQRPGLAGLFAAIGVYQVLSGRYLGSATSLLFYSMVTRRLASSEREKRTRAQVASEATSEALERPPKKRPEVVFPRRS